MSQGFWWVSDMFTSRQRRQTLEVIELKLCNIENNSWLWRGEEDFGVSGFKTLGMKAKRFYLLLNLIALRTLLLSVHNLVCNNEIAITLSAGIYRFLMWNLQHHSIYWQYIHGVIQTLIPYKKVRMVDNDTLKQDVINKTYRLKPLTTKIKRKLFLFLFLGFNVIWWW